jgi:endonuclease/exonuclease/phosphatase family metal-dependent hydrolase
MAQYRRDLFRLLEAAFVGIFFVQAARFLFGTLYAHFNSADLVTRTADPAALSLPGVVLPATLQNELIVTGALLLLPLLSLIFNRLWLGPAIAAVVVAAGRVFMTANGGTPFGVYGAAAAVGGGLLYLAIIAVRRPSMFAPVLILGIAIDQLVRLYGNTVDFTWEVTFLEEQTAISLGLFLIAILTTVFERTTVDPEGDSRGEIGGWGAFALAGILYLQFAVLGLANTLSNRVGMNYVVIAPWLVAATLIPLIGEVRGIARRFLGMFDGQFRGWVWTLLLMLLLVVGLRLNGVGAAAALLITQAMIGLTAYWVVQPFAGRVNFTPFGMIIATALFLLFAGADLFTYEYAFVRGLAEPAASLLRGFRGLGLAITLLAALFGGLPIILTRKRSAWRTANPLASLVAVALTIGAGVFAVSLARPTVVSIPTDTTLMRVVTLNLHGGFGLYFNHDLEEIATEIRKSGADVVLLQEADAGRLIGYGIDLPAWLGRTLNMQVTYFPTNEGLEGLAILSRLSIEREEGRLLTSSSRQTGVQFVRIIAPDGSPLDVYNAQLSLIFRGGVLTTEELEAEQQQQIQEVVQFIELNGSLPNRVVLGGTFNHQPDSDIYLYLVQQGYIDPFVDYAAERAVTLRRVNEPPVRVDYLWLRCRTPVGAACITPTGRAVTPLQASSHNLAIVQIGLE